MELHEIEKADSFHERHIDSHHCHSYFSARPAHSTSVRFHHQQPTALPPGYSIQSIGRKKKHVQDYHQNDFDFLDVWPLPILASSNRKSVSGFWRFYTRHQARVFVFLTISTSFWSIFYHTLTLLVLLAFVIMVIIASVPQYNFYLNNPVVIGFQSTLTLLYIGEYVLKMWSCVSKPLYNHPFYGRLKYGLTFWMLIELVTSAASLISLIIVFSTNNSHFVTNATLINVVRLVRCIEILKYFSRAKHQERDPLKIFSRVWKEYKFVIAIIFGLVLIVTVIIGSLQFLIETTDPSKIDSIPLALYWAVITLSTIGYGDVVPATDGGKVFAMFTAFFFCAIFSIPGVLFGSAFVSQFENIENELKKKNREQTISANIIANWWRGRCLRANTESSKLLIFLSIRKLIELVTDQPESEENFTIIGSSFFEYEKFRVPKKKVPFYLLNRLKNYEFINDVYEKLPFALYLVFLMSYRFAMRRHCQALRLHLNHMESSIDDILDRTTNLRLLLLSKFHHLHKKLSAQKGELVEHEDMKRSAVYTLRETQKEMKEDIKQLQIKMDQILDLLKKKNT